VLRLQRDRYLPLKVIREYLDALERGEEVRLPSLGRMHDGGDGERLGDLLSEPEAPTAARIGRDELLAAAEISGEQLQEWESYGLVGPLSDGMYDAEAVTVATLVAELGGHGIEPRHLRVMKAAADREAGLVDQVVAPLRRHRNPQTRAHAEARAKELAGLAVKLHAALVQSALGVRLP
jgi:DNA-binding transcriptional MerR regulator